MGRLGSGPRLVSRIGSVIQVSVSFQLAEFCPVCFTIVCLFIFFFFFRCFSLMGLVAWNKTDWLIDWLMSYEQKTRLWRRGLCPEGFDLPSSPAYNVKPVTNTRRSPPSVAALFLTLRDSYGWQHCIDMYAAKPDIRPESRFCLPHLHSTPPLGGSRQNIAIPFRMEN